MAIGPVYLIWSNEHRRWWGPGGRGYVTTFAAAGCYTREAAIDIVRRAQDGRSGSHQPPPEIMVLIDDVKETIKW